MKKVLFLIFFTIILSVSITSVKAGTFFDIVGNRIVDYYDPIPSNFHVEVNTSLEIIIVKWVEEVNRNISTYRYTPMVIHLVASPEKYTLVSYNGIQIASGDCHYITETYSPIFETQVGGICHISDTRVIITWSEGGFIPVWLDDIEIKLSALESLFNTLNTTVTNILTSITSILNTLTNHETRIFSLEHPESTTTTTSTSTTIKSTSTTTTTTISVCKGKTYSTCISLPNCKWVGDLRTGHCESK